FVLERLAVEEIGGDPPLDQLPYVAILEHQQGLRRRQHPQHHRNGGGSALLGDWLHRAPLEDALYDCGMAARCHGPPAPRPPDGPPRRLLKIRSKMRRTAAAHGRDTALVRSSSRRIGRLPTRYHAHMAAPGITRHRRPFLAPVWVSLLVAVLLAGVGWAFY